MVKENLKYDGQYHVLSDPPKPGNGPAEEDLGFKEPAAEPEPVKPGTRIRKTRRALQEFLGGDYLSKEWVTGNISYILFVALLAMIYIANTYNTEKKFKMIERTKTELKELRYEYITTKSALMFLGRQSEISKRAVQQGLKEAKMPPFKIRYSGDSLAKKASGQ
jgi:hypothetical protein